MKNDAILEFYNKYSKEVYLYIIALCKDHYLAQDIMQETFVKAILSLDRCHENTKAWLFRVGRNLLIDHIRRNKNMMEVNLEEIQIQDTSVEIIKEIIKNEESLILYNYVCKMSKSMREVIVLYYYLEIPQSKIAEIMSISHGSVRTLLYRGRKILKERMDRNEYEV